MRTAHSRLAPALRWAALALLLGLSVLAATDAHAGRKVEIPVDIGIGPAAYWMTGPVARDQTLHFGLAISVHAIIDKKTIRKYRKRIPKQYRDMAMRMNEVRYSPSIFIPDALILSPKVRNTGVYGAMWRPIGLNVPLLDTTAAKARFGVGAVLGAAFLHSTTLDAPNTLFLRPGLDAKLEMEVAFSDRWLVSGGWVSRGFVPQVIGGAFLDVQPIDSAILHVGQPFLQLHYRFPYRVAL